ncbi:glycosyl transferase [Caballeronia terrestris]|uniref:Glycosyl transferase n=1 Tax=Caballeronia terrestris TaxID=1226301 RepID=A0A158KMG8_9BURK|nr:glycosyltransferase [Caballeronia terrestris]SAL82378.1 glycosyl transferase [Caballeronia terrestris]
MQERIMFVITGLNLGGAESQLVLLVRELRRIGWDVAVVSMIEPRYFVQELEGIGVTVVTMKMCPGKPDILALWRLARLVKSWRPSIMHSHMFHANVFARVARLFFPSVPLISTAHSLDELEGSYGRLVAYRLTRHLSSFMTSVSVTSFRHYVSLRIISPKKGRFVPNGVDLERFKYDAAKRAQLRSALGIGDLFVWLAIGRLAPAKDFANLIGAVAHLRDRGLSAVRVLLVGEGPDRDHLMRLAADAKLDKYIQFLGPRHDVPDLMSAADALVLSSAWEGLPMVILEAMASSRIVVATDVGGVSELFAPSDLGLLAPPRHSEVLADRMSEVMNFPVAKIEEAGQRGRIFVERNFDIQKVARAWDGLYRQLAG